MSELLSVKIAKVAPAGATAVAEAVYADRLTKVPGRPQGGAGPTRASPARSARRWCSTTASTHGCWSGSGPSPRWVPTSCARLLRCSPGRSAVIAASAVDYPDGSRPGRRATASGRSPRAWSWAAYRFDTLQVARPAPG